MQPILFSAVGFTSKGKEFPKSLTPHNFSWFLTNQGLEFIRVLMEDREEATCYLKELSRGDSLKVWKINNELMDMESCGILTLYWPVKSSYYQKFHFPDLIELNKDYC